MSPSSIILTVTLGRSWADHGQIMGRPWVIDSCRKILKMSAFFDTVFSENLLNFAIFRQGTSKAPSYVCRPRWYSILRNTSVPHLPGLGVVGMRCNHQQQRPSANRAKHFATHIAHSRRITANRSMAHHL